MGFIYTRGKTHIEGHKELTKHLEVEKITDPKVVGKIYIPKVAGNGQPITFEVKEGDKVKKGQRIGMAPGFYMPVYSSVSGKVLAEENIYNSLVGRPVPHLVIENDMKDTWDKPLKKVDYTKASHEELVNAIKEAGINGLGGAGFPTYVKYDKAENMDCLIINAIECEPYLTTDYHNMENNAEKLIRGIEILMKASTAKRAVIGIKVGKEELVAKLKSVLGNRTDITIHETPDVYPMGWERVLVYEILKKEYKGLPSEAGAVINNATTAIAVATALEEGRPITDKVITVSGDAITPHVVEVPVYTQVKGIVEYCGGYTSDNIVLLAGGPMTAKPMMNDNFVIEKQCGALTILKYVDYKPSPCLRCGRCVNNCPASLYPVEIKDAVDKKDIERIKALKASECIECGTCSWTCPSKIDVKGAMSKAKLFLKLEQAKQAAAQKK